ncbi:DUF6515 family protein [Erwinia psidii]|uniref:Uncharacterized protein n=1 Tax=Erwinia psidii TaxID=69224 RepID=A0A3N6S2V9_9GAMM|nr:DUF6515 family protein [Erwinia psidii]RQM39167.1 hypothetical protein EB241_05260 [Erwinia psidii]
MKKVISTLLSLTLLSPVLVSAHPGGWDRGPGPGWGHGGGHGPGRLSILPDAAAAVIIGGLTYYALNGMYYQRQNDNTYVVVQPPAERLSGSMNAVDYNGERFYVQYGHYYRRDIDGRYLEVPRPPGL